MERAGPSSSTGVLCRLPAIQGAHPVGALAGWPQHRHQPCRIRSPVHRLQGFTLRRPPHRLPLIYCWRMIDPIRTREPYQQDLQRPPEGRPINSDIVHRGGSSCKPGELGRNSACRNRQRPLARNFFVSRSIGYERLNEHSTRRQSLRRGRRFLTYFSEHLQGCRFRIAKRYLNQYVPV